MNTIIAATDYSEIAENAVEYAAAIAKFKKERLILLNDIMAIHAENARLSADNFQELQEVNQGRLEQKAASLSDKYGIEVLPKATNSYVEKELADLIDEYQVYMVVMGMASGSRFQEIWGNTTTSAIKKLPVNVLAVPEKAKFEGLKKVLFACDALHEVSDVLLNRIKNIGLILPAEVEVLFISTDPKQTQETSEGSWSLKNINDRLEGISHHYENVSADSIVEGIRMEVIRSNADLLVMAPQKHGFWDSLVHRSKTRLMASGLDIPLLSVRL